MFRSILFIFFFTYIIIFLTRKIFFVKKTPRLMSAIFEACNLPLKQSGNISNKNWIYELPKTFWEKLKNTCNYSLVPRPPLKTKTLLILVKKYWKLGIELSHSSLFPIALLNLTEKSYLHIFLLFLFLTNVAHLKTLCKCLEIS